MIGFDGAKLVVEETPAILEAQKKFKQKLTGETDFSLDSATASLARDVRALDPWLRYDLAARPVGVTAPEAGYIFYTKPDGTLAYRKRVFADLRRPHLPWQVYGWSRQGYLQGLKRYIFKMLPRRSGKTFDDCSKGIDMMVKYGCVRNDPVMAYYCPDKGQAMRNAWSALTMASRNIPGVVHDKNNALISWPAPIPGNPRSTVKAYLFGVRGGGEKKRGGYYDVCIMDEIEFFARAFIEEVGMASTFDRDGIFVGSGTPYNMGILDYYLDEAKKRMRIQKAMADKEDVTVPSTLSDWDEWHAVEGDCWSLKVYSTDKLLKFKATIGEARFAQEMECKNPPDIKLYYYRDAIKRAEEDKLVTTMLRPDENLPLRVYYDLGIGQKTDRMAWSVWQFDNVRPMCLAGGTVVGKSFSDIIAAVRTSVYGEMKFFEHVLPHDAKAREQSDGGEKRKKFAEELRRQGVSGWQRVSPLKRHKNPELIVGEVNDSLKVAMFHEIHAMEILDALRNHKRKFDKENNIVVEQPSKTKWRDGADMVRYAVIDWRQKDYLVRAETFAAEVTPTRSFDEHPMEGSVLDVDTNVTETLIGGW